MQPRHRRFAAFQSPALYIVAVGLRVGRFVDRSSPFQKYAYRDIPCPKAVSLFLCPFILCIDDVSTPPCSRHVLYILAKHAVITFVLITPSMHSIRRCFRLRGGSAVRKKKRSLGLRYLLIAVTSAPNCTPKPEALPRPHSSPFSPFFSLLLVPEPRRSRFCLSLPYHASHGSQLRVLSRGLLDERRLVRNSRSSSGGRLGILIRVPKYREVANLISLKKFARYDIQDVSVGP